MDEKKPVPGPEQADASTDEPVLETVLVAAGQGAIGFVAPAITTTPSTRTIEEGDPEALATLESARHQVGALMRQMEVCAWDIGAILAPILRDRVYNALGETDFNRYCVREHGIAGRQARMYIDFAVNYQRPMYVALGFNRANALLQYVRATPKDDKVTELEGEVLRFGPGAGKPIEWASTDELVEAARGERSEANSEPADSSGVEKIAADLQAALGDAVKVGLGKRVRKGEEPPARTLNLQAVHLSDFRRVGEALIGIAEQHDQE